MIDRAWCVTIAVSLCGFLSAHLWAKPARAAVIVHNRADVPAAVLSDARTMVQRIYAGAGIDLVWFLAGPTLKHVPFDGLKLRLIIITKKAADQIGYVPDSVGFTPGSNGHFAPLAYVLDHRVRQVAQGYNVRREVVLGATMAHELGHMLLQRGHSTVGLMRAEFNQADFRRIASGDMPFTLLTAMDLRMRLLGSAREVLRIP